MSEYSKPDVFDTMERCEADPAAADAEALERALNGLRELSFDALELVSTELSMLAAVAARRSPEHTDVAQAYLQAARVLYVLAHATPPASGDASPRAPGDEPTTVTVVRDQQSGTYTMIAVVDDNEVYKCAGWSTRDAAFAHGARMIHEALRGGDT